MGWRYARLRRSLCRQPAKRQLLLPVVVGLVLALAVIRWFDAALRPQLIALAETQIQNRMAGIADRAVTQALIQEGTQQGEMIHMQSQQLGNAVAISVDTPRLNLLRTSILDCVILQVESLDSHSLGVPIGALTGFDLLSSFGPQMPVQVFSVASAQGIFRNEFSSAGINQTLHRIMMDVTITARLLLPGGIVETELSTPVCVAETLIIGQVPQTYLNWNGGGGEP